MTPQDLLRHTENLLKQILRFEHPADTMVARYFREHRQLGMRDRSVLTQTVYTVIRKKAYLTDLANLVNIRSTLERRLAILAWQGDKEWIQRALSPAECEWLNNTQQINDANRLATLPEHIQYNLPQWLLAHLQAQLGDALSAFIQSTHQSAPLDLRVNTLKIKRDKAQKLLAESGIQTQFTPYSPWGLRVQGKPALNQLSLYNEGYIEIQDEGSQLLALLTGAKRNELMIDFCAGAGGKTLALGASMRNTGRLYAWDTSAHRLDAIKPRLQRSGLNNVHTAAISHECDIRVQRFYNKADRVLVDAPCSGLGTLRRSPDLKWRHSPETIEQINETQAKILNAACKLPKVGGVLVYATCSILQEENENMVKRFNAQHPEFEALDIEQALTTQGVQQASQLVKGQCLRLWPHLHHTDGFFAAMWKRIH